MEERSGFDAFVLKEQQYSLHQEEEGSMRRQKGSLGNTLGFCLHLILGSLLAPGPLGLCSLGPLLPPMESSSLLGTLALQGSL